MITLTLASLAPFFLTLALLLVLQCFHNAKEAVHHKVCSQYTRIYAPHAQFLRGYLLHQHNAHWQTVYATNLLHCGDYAAAKKAFEAAFAMAATPAQAHVNYMQCLMSLGERSAANDWLKVFKANKSYNFLPHDLRDDYTHLAANITAKRTARYKTTVVHHIEPLPFYHQPWFITTLLILGITAVLPGLITLLV